MFNKSMKNYLACKDKIQKQKIQDQSSRHIHASLIKTFALTLSLLAITFVVLLITSGSKLFLFLKYFFEKVNFETSQQTRLNKSMQRVNT